MLSQAEGLPSRHRDPPLIFLESRGEVRGQPSRRERQGRLVVLEREPLRSAVRLGLPCFMALILWQTAARMGDRSCAVA